MCATHRHTVIPHLLTIMQDPAPGIQSMALMCLGKLSAADPLLSQVMRRGAGGGGRQDRIAGRESWTVHSQD